MSTPRLYRCHIHFDGVKTRPDPLRCPDLWVMDDKRPVDSVDPYTDFESALEVARQVSRNGGSATVTYRAPGSRKTVTWVHFGPWDVAIDELIEEAHR
ncbi:hypothetical protein [Nocardia transvalensis]|uniref:hypothetical protein n=1 Tax=Nocardia transvalensis TaxID=37333 RepID=UPI001895F202|nr:hypothetical protein [Nocardia transvalensis]MBF6333521.1 hypothetical protein [Nocardia transvalensis]